MLSKLFTSKITLILSFLLLAAGLVAGVTVIRYPQILFPEAAQCPSQGPFKLYCTWDAPVGAVSYDYAVTKETTNGNIELVKTETGITETHANFDGYPDDKYTCSVYAYNDCGSKSQLAVGTPFSCTAPAPTPVPGCEGCVRGTEKKYPADVWDKNGNGQIDDCAEACLAFFGPNCTNGTCGNPGSTNPAKCCSCQTADGASCATLPTPTPPPGCNCTDADWDCQTDCADDSYETPEHYCYNCDVPNFSHYCCPVAGETPPPEATPTQGACLDPYTYCTPGEHTCCDNGGDYECLPYDNPADSHTCQLVPTGECGNGILDPGEVCDYNKKNEQDGAMCEGCGYRCKDSIGHYEQCEFEGNNACQEYFLVRKEGKGYCSTQCGSSQECSMKVEGDSCSTGKSCNDQCQCTPAATGTISGTVTVTNNSSSNIDAVRVYRCEKGDKGKSCLGTLPTAGPTDDGIWLTNKAGKAWTYTYRIVTDSEYKVIESGATYMLLNASAQISGNYFDSNEVKILVVAPATQNFTITIPAEQPAIVQGDISGPEGKPDGVVDAADASVLMSNWGVPFGFNPAADLNGDGKVNALDASLLIQSWSGK